MSAYWTKAIVAARSAHLLLAAGDRDGAASRAYYAMLDAARAALEKVDPDLLNARTHATIIRRFGQHVVSAAGLDRDLGRALNSAEDLRLAADYGPASIDLEAVSRVLAEMDRLLSAVATLLEEPSP